TPSLVLRDPLHRQREPGLESRRYRAGGILDLGPAAARSRPSRPKPNRRYAAPNSLCTKEPPMKGNSEQETTAAVQPVSNSTRATGLTRTDVIRRTTGPETTHGSRWDVQLSATPPCAWLEFCRQARGASAFCATAPRPQR